MKAVFFIGLFALPFLGTLRYRLIAVYHIIQIMWYFVMKAYFGRQNDTKQNYDGDHRAIVCIDRYWNSVIRLHAVGGAKRYT